jgi:hypothetical protein
MPIIEEVWADADTTPTHIILMFSAGSGEAYVGTEGLVPIANKVAVR